MLSQTHRIVQALLFTAQEPLTQSQVELCLQEKVNLDNIITEISDYFEQEKMPIWIQKIGQGYRIMTRAEYESWIRRLFQDDGNVRLTRAALEILAIIAYKQPITRSEIDAIRGVSSYLKTLLDKKLIEVRGRQNGPGRPLLYGTTSHFLEYFGLNSIQDLPSLKEVEDVVNVGISENDEEEHADQ